MKKIVLIVVLGLAILAGVYFWDAYEEEKAMELVSPEELRDLSSRQNDFALASFKEIANDYENAFISPYSIHTALLLAYVGSDGETRREMEEVLVLRGMEETEIKEKAMELKKYLENVSEETEVSIANSFFLRDDVPFLESYRNDGVEYFDAELRNLPQEGEVVNQWVREKTEDKIEEIIDSGPIPSDVIAYLVNAIYFKGVWEKEFDEERTTERTFYGLEEQEVEMMENKATYRYKTGENVKAVTLEYKNGDYLFHAFMPKEGTLSDFYNKADAIKDVKEEMRKGEITLRLPKFTLEEDIKLAEVLQIMGIVEGFDKERADFSRMVDRDELGLNVYISEVYHSSFIEVDEEGTEAAAATAVEMRMESAPIEDPTIIEFNKPFLFMIEEADTETILFIGQMVDFS